MGRLFGTNGVRGIVGDTMTEEVARRLGVATAHWLAGTGTMAVGRDHRASGPSLQAAFEDGLHGGGIDTIDLGICPTPGIQWWTRQADVRGAAIVTASHNPPEWNGIKIIEADGTDAAPATERAIEGAFDAPAASSAGTGRRTGAADAATPYVEAVLGQVDAEAIRGAGFKAVLDPGGGAGCVTAPRLLASLGVEVVPVSCELDPGFSDRPSEPTEANAARCMEAVKESGADLGILQDGDADRSVFVDERARFVDGNVALAMVAAHEMRDASEDERIVCTTVASSSAVVATTEAAGGRIEWTVVGSPPVARAMRETGAAFGGEGNGGFLFARHQFGKDGLMAMARVLEILATTGKPMSALVDAVPRFAFVQSKIDVPEDRKDALMAAFKLAAADEADIQRIDDRDGVKAYVEGGWALIRPSGTEAIFRVQTEAGDEEAAKALNGRFRSLLASLV